MSHLWTWKYNPFDTTEYGEEHLREEIKKNWIYHKAIIDKMADELAEKWRKEFES